MLKQLTLPALLAVGFLVGCGQQSAPPRETGDRAATQRPTVAREGATIQDFMPRVETDVFNPRVSEAMREQQTPQRGGVLRLRNPANLRGLNVITVSGQPELTVIREMTDSLVDRCPETLEFFPEMARFWAETDLIKHAGGETIEGCIVRRDDATISFVAGAWRYTFNKFDIAEMNVEEGVLFLRDGTSHRGQITEGIYTITIDEGIGGGTKPEVVIPVSELATYERELGALTQTLPFAKMNCAFRFFLRDDVTWHDGNPFTVDDVIFTIDTIKNPQVEAQRLRASFDDVVLYEADHSNNSVTFHYAHPYFEALSTLGFVSGSALIIPRHVFQPEQFGGDEEAFARFFNSHPFSERPIYTGPYRFRSWERGNALIIERNPNYWKNRLPAEELIRWSPEQPWIDEIRWILYTDASAAFRDLINERLDADLDVEPTMFASPDTRQAFFTDRLYRAESLGMLYTYIGWNHERAMFQDVRVRRALAMLVPRREITENVHLGAAIPVSGPFFVEGPAYDPTVELIEYDPDGARALLAEAGWLDRNRDGILDKVIDGRSVDLAFTYHIHNARDYHQKIADIIKERIEQVGIRMTIVRSDWSDFADTVRRKEFDAVRFAWGASLEPNPFQIWHSSQIRSGGDNFISFANDRIDEISIEIRETFDPIRRWELAREFHRIVAQEQPVCFLYGMKEQYFINQRVRGVRFYANPFKHNFSEWWIAPENAP